MSAAHWGRERALARRLHDYTMQYRCENCEFAPDRDYIDGWMPEWPRCPVCGENLTLEAVHDLA